MLSATALNGCQIVTNTDPATTGCSLVCVSRVLSALETKRLPKVIEIRIYVRSDRNRFLDESRKTFIETRDKGGSALVHNRRKA